MREFRKLLEEYGADYQATMDRFLGNEALYRRVLNMLPQDKSLQKLGDALKSGDRAGAFEAAHTLKGVCGNLGLTPLYQAVCTIVEPLRTGEVRDDYPAMYQAIYIEFQKVEALLKKQEGGKQS